MNSSEQRTACAVCGGSLGQELLRITKPDRFELFAGVEPEGYWRSWVECDDCGAATNVQIPENQAKLAALSAGYYEVDFAGSSIAEKFRKITTLPAERSDNAQRVKRVRNFMHSWREKGFPGRVLDIGAGTGVFLWGFLESAGSRWAGVAVEPDPNAAEHLRTLGRFEVIEDIFEEHLGLSGFELVTLNKVVEHLPDPLMLVKAAATALTPEGVLYVEVPDRLTIGRRPPNDNILGALHCHLYDPRSLGTLLMRTGLAILRIERVFDPSGKLTVAAFAVTQDGLRLRAASREI